MAMTKVGIRQSVATTDVSAPLVAHMMVPGVVQIPGDVSVSEAALLMERERVPCLLVRDSEFDYGIMTSGDIVKKVVAPGLEPHDVDVRTIMSKPVHSIEYNRMLDQAMSLMASTGVPLLIVTKESQPVGILSVWDLALAPRRCDTSLPVTISVPVHEGQGANHSGTIRQLSHVGAYVETSTLLLPDSQVVLRFSLPGREMVFVVRGIIVSSFETQSPSPGAPDRRLPGVDIQFMDVPSDDESKIRAWVLQNLSKRSDQF